MTVTRGTRASATRARILQAASACFAETGFDGTSTRTVANRASVNIATLNYHFGGKDGLHHAVLFAAHDELAVFEPPQAPGDTAEERVRVVVAAFYRFAVKHQGALRLLLRTSLKEGALPEDLRTRQTADGLQRAQALLGAMDLPTGAHVTPLALLSINHLVVRYALSADHAVAPFVPGDVRDGLADHLGDVAVSLLLGPDA